jgi:hypothetical protein
MSRITAHLITQSAAALRTYDFGRSTEALEEIDGYIRSSFASAELRAVLRRELAGVLDSDVSFAGKQFACEKLSILGSEAIPALVRLLASPDVHLAEAACYALRSASSPAADAAIRDALENAHGPALLALIDLAGSHQDAQSAQLLAAVTKGLDQAAAQSAVVALGKIATPDAIGTLTRLASDQNGPLHITASQALLHSAQVLASRGWTSQARDVLLSIATTGMDARLRRGAQHLLAGLATDEGFQPLFNGRDLSEWEVDTPGLWSVRNGVIIGHSLGLKYNDFLRWRTEYGNFVLRARMRMIDGDGNSGIQFRTQRIPNSHELSGYQADAGETFWGSLYDESRRAKTLGAPGDDFLDRFDIGAWHTYQISAEGRRICLELDGVQTVDYEEREPGIPQRGIIALQIHAWPHPTEVWFTDLAIRTL